MKIPFVKMHGIGNDFVLIDNLNKEYKIDVELIRNMADRRFGIGADQILVLEPSISSDYRMLIYNADGSQVEMCGNGIRCLASYLKQNYQVGQKLNIETLAGEREITFQGDLIEVDMGVPVLSPDKIPVNVEGDRVVMREVNIGNETFSITAISMGNPHCVLFVESVESFPLEKYGPMFENHEMFPNGTNFECVQIVDDRTVRTRVWERGVGVTLACGTGACASYVAACITGRTGKSGSVILDGGELQIRWQEENGHVVMLGPTKEVFRGTFPLL